MTTATALSPLIGLVIIAPDETEDFLAFSLPSLLAPGNLPALSRRLRLRVLGDAAALAALRGAPAMVRAATRLAITFVLRPAPPSWAAVAADPELRGLPLLRLDPLVVWSEGALPAIAARLDNGMSRVETVVLPVEAAAARDLLAGDAALKPQLLARLALKETGSGGKRRGAAQRALGCDFARQIGPGRFAVHTPDWDVVGAIAGGPERPTAFLADGEEVLALRLGRRSERSRAALVRQLAASGPARLRFRQRFEFGGGAPVKADAAALARDLAAIDSEVGDAMAAPRQRLLIAAWTRPYIELLLRLTLPSLTSGGNLPRLETAERRLPVTMLCLAADRSACEAVAEFRAFARHRVVEWDFIDDLVATFGTAREAILSVAFRRAMARHWEPEAELAFLLLKPGHVVADGALPALVRPALEGARAVLLPTPRAELGVVRALIEELPLGTRTRHLARAVVDDAIEEAVLAPLDSGLVRAVSDQVALNRGPGRLSLRAARWHPAVLRPARRPQSGRQSLIDMEVVPELAETDEVHRVADSDEALIVDARSPRPPAGELVSVGELANRVALWATPWQRRNLAAGYDIVAEGDAATAAAPAAIAGLALPSTPAIPAERHPAWLAARSLTLISPQTGDNGRYTSDLDGYYRVARLAIEQADAADAIYAGHARHVFSPLLARRFERAYLTDVDRLLADPASLRAPDRTTLYVLHLDLTLYQSLCLTGTADRFFLEPTGSGHPIVLIVESPDGHGGLRDLDKTASRQWEARLGRLAAVLGMKARLESTLIEFFEGHPGFVVRIAAAPAALLTLPPPQQDAPPGAAARPAGAEDADGD